MMDALDTPMDPHAPRCPEPLAVVLAAGKGTRMCSELPKVLVPAAGRPMLEYPLTALREAGVGRVLLVVGYREQDVRAAFADRAGVRFVTQPQQLGTGHAVLCCVGEIQAWLREAGTSSVPVVVAAGDSPMMRAATIHRLLEAWYARPCACVLGTISVQDPTGMGRILRDRDGRFCGIIEEKDATDLQRRIREVNPSYYVFRAADLLEALAELRPENAQGEFYITDVPGILLGWGRDVLALDVLAPDEAVSVNTPEQLRVAERLLRDRDRGA